jgi:hypothetical protein
MFFELIMSKMIIQSAAATLLSWPTRLFSSFMLDLIWYPASCFLRLAHVDDDSAGVIFDGAGWSYAVNADQALCGRRRNSGQDLEMAVLSRLLSCKELAWKRRFRMVMR